MDNDDGNNDYNKRVKTKEVIMIIYILLYAISQAIVALHNFLSYVAPKNKDFI